MDVNIDNPLCYCLGISKNMSLHSKAEHYMYYDMPPSRLRVTWHQRQIKSPARPLHTILTQNWVSKLLGVV